MSFVNVTALTSPEGTEQEIERRFAARARSADSAPGFQGFELLRPVYGEKRYLVVTRWDSREDFESWPGGRPSGKRDDDSLRGTSVELLGFEVVQQEGGPVL